MDAEVDFIARFAKTKIFDIRQRTIFVEGTTDVDIFSLASKLEKEYTGDELLDDNLAVIAAGEGELGGVRGVCRELVSFKNMAGGYLLPNGRPKYRFVGLLDNDRAGRQAINDVRKVDSSILEYKDIFRIQPVMPLNTNLDPQSIKRRFESDNEEYKSLDWELEDLIVESTVTAFLLEYPDSVIRETKVNRRTHREWTQDGKARFNRFIKENAIRSDLITVIETMKALRYYLNIKPVAP